MVRKSDEFAEAIAEFVSLYADQTEKDYDQLKGAERKGIIEALPLAMG